MKIKILTSLMFLLLMGPFSILIAQDQTGDLAKIKELVNKASYRIDIDRVSSASVPNPERFNPTGTFQVSDSMIIADLPFFGRAYNSVGYDGEAGIQLNDKYNMREIKDGKKELIVNYKVNNKGENFDCTLTLYPGDKAILNIISSKRESITYYGTYKAVKK